MRNINYGEIQIFLFLKNHLDNFKSRIYNEEKIVALEKNVNH